MDSTHRASATQYVVCIKNRLHGIWNAVGRGGGRSGIMWGENARRFALTRFFRCEHPFNSRSHHAHIKAIARGRARCFAACARRSQESGAGAARRAPGDRKRTGRVPGSVRRRSQRSKVGAKRRAPGDRGAHRCTFESRPFGAEEGKRAMRPLPPIWREDEPTRTLP